MTLDAGSPDEMGADRCVWSMWARLVGTFIDSDAALAGN